MSDKSRLADFLLCPFLRVLCIHKIYEGKMGFGVLYLFTKGLFEIGAFVDLIVILVGSAKGSDWQYNINGNFLDLSSLIVDNLIVICNYVVY